MNPQNRSIPSSEQMNLMVDAGYGKLTVHTHAIATERFYFLSVDEMERMTPEEREQYGLVEMYEYAKKHMD